MIFYLAPLCHETEKTGKAKKKQWKETSEVLPYFKTSGIIQEIH